MVAYSKIYYCFAIQMHKMTDESNIMQVHFYDVFLLQNKSH